MKDYNLPPATEKAPDLAYCRSCGKSHNAAFDCLFCTESLPEDSYLLTEEEQLEAFIGRERRREALRVKEKETQARVKTAFMATAMDLKQRRPFR